MSLTLQHSYELKFKNLLLVLLFYRHESGDGSKFVRHREYLSVHGYDEVLEGQAHSTQATGN